MGKTKRSQLSIYIDPDKFEQLVALAVRTRRLRTVLTREAIDDLLRKYRILSNETDKP